MDTSLHSTNMIKSLLMNTNGVLWKMLVSLLSTIFTFSRKKSQQTNYWDSLTQSHMSWLTIGLEISLPWNGGMTYGWMKVSLILSVTFALKKSETDAKLSTMNPVCQCSWTEKVGVIMKIKWSLLTQLEEQLLTPVLLTLSLMVSLILKVLPQWNNFCSWWKKKISQKLCLNISKNMNGLMLPWLILLLKWKNTIMSKNSLWINGDSSGLKNHLLTKSKLHGIQLTKTKRLKLKSLKLPSLKSIQPWDLTE